jgi:hypothetical protein
MRIFQTVRCGGYFSAAVLVLVAVPLLSASAAADVLYVSCGVSQPPPGTFPTINAALSTLALNSQAEPHTINVTGTCTENVNLSDRQRITLQGAGDGSAEILANNPAGTVMNIVRSRSITLRRLVIGGGSSGVYVTDSSQVDLQDITIQNNHTRGMQASDGSNVQLTRVTIMNNQGTGLFVDDFSFAILGEGPTDQYADRFVHIHDNVGVGISVSSGKVFIRGYTTVENNRGSGISVTDGTVTFSGNPGENIVRNNNSPGISLLSGSTGVVSGKLTIQSNGDMGIQVGRASSILFNSATMPDGSIGATTIEGHGAVGLSVDVLASATLIGPHKVLNNGASPSTELLRLFRSGIRVSANGTVTLRLGVEVSNNIGAGVLADFEGTVRLGYPMESSTGSVTGNSEHGILLLRASQLWIGSPATVTGNGIAPISCDRSSWLFGNLTGIAGIDCKNVITDDEKKK